MYEVNEPIIQFQIARRIAKLTDCFYYGYSTSDTGPETNLISPLLYYRANKKKTHIAKLKKLCLEFRINLAWG